MPLATGHKIGPYEIVSPLGAGGMGEMLVSLNHPNIAVVYGVEGSAILIKDSHLRM